jgi:FdhD protein
MAARIAKRHVERPGPLASGDDAVAVEEPLEIRVAGERVAITMRTPGEDPRLALGFLFAEGIIGSADDVGSVAHCGRPGHPGYGNVLDVVPASGARLDWQRVDEGHRGTLVTSACGVCGRQTIDDLLAACRPLDDATEIAGAALLRAVEGLSQAQSLFASTGGTHAAAACDAGGAPLAFAEDVGRHNAVDKVVGALLVEGRLAPGGGRDGRAAAILAVSGRASFEIVQKAARARIPVVASVSAPSSLAVDLAAAARVTLASFVRRGGYALYAHAQRIRE